jgi:hypothetical protein|tara:strand:+ start:298 stop:477 length:180 start_codon:yes stop_codon:yes gene_type:complete
MEGSALYAIPLTSEREEFIKKYSELYNMPAWKFVTLCIDIVHDMDDDTIFDDKLKETMQ